MPNGTHRFVSVSQLRNGMEQPQGGDECIPFDPFLYRPIRRKSVGWRRSPGIPPTRWIWRRGEPVSSLAAIQKTRVALLRRSARGPRHRQQPPGRLPPGRGGGQRRPVRRGELAARVRPLPRRMGRPRAGLRACLSQAHRHHVPHADDPAGPAAAALDPAAGGPQPGHRGHDESRRAAPGERLSACRVRACG